MDEELAQLDAAAVSSCLEVSVWALSPGELASLLDGLHAQQLRLAAAQLAVVRELDGQRVAKTQGATSTAVWLRNRLRLSIGAARQLVAVAASLDAGPSVVRDALAAGDVTLDQARVVGAVVDALPVEVGPEVADEAARLLVDWAGRFEPAVLAGMGRRILTHVAPDLAEEADRKALGREAKRALEQRHLTFSHRDDRAGAVDRVVGRGDRGGAARRPGPAVRSHGLDDTRTPGQRRVDALAEVCRLALRTTELPEHGGDRPQIVITTDYDALTGRLGAGTLDTGLRLTPETVRRLACDAQILPVVLDGAGQVVDLGRLRRLVTGPTRRVLVIRDRGCAFPGCDRPPRWCDGHHIQHWADGGDSAPHNAVLLCGHHHRLGHHDDWTVRIASDGLPEFIPPAWLDPLQLPRRNHYHQRQ